MSDNPAPPVPPPVTPTPDDPTPDDPTINDVAAELDDPITAGASASDDTDDDDDFAVVYTGPCQGGPYNGQTMTSRFPKGFLLVDRPGNRAWLYDFAAGVFFCRGQVPYPADGVDIPGIAEGIDFDVIAYDPKGPPV
jgi:hypothetical protein